jgi:hypothetical protein
MNRVKERASRIAKGIRMDRFDMGNLHFVPGIGNAVDEHAL